MKIITNIFFFCSVAGTLCFKMALSEAQSVDEQRLVSILKSNATLQEKDAACAELKRIGTAQSVPALAELLADTELSHSARYALESMPAAEAGRALIEALDKTNGLTRAGIVHSLGQRREAAAVPRLVKLLADSDTNVASAAAGALGRIGGEPAVRSLLRALSAAPKAKPPEAILDALLVAANQALTESRRGSASAVFKKLYKMPVPDHARTAAYRGLIASANASRSLELVKAGLQSGDNPSRTAALEMAREINAPKATRVLGEMLGLVAPITKIALIEALRQRGDTAAVRALVVAAKSPDPGVRIAALGALGDLGDDTAVDVLLEAAGSADGAEKKAARQALLVLRHGDITKSLLAKLAAGKPALQAEAARALAGRGDKEAVAELIVISREHSGSTRAGAFLVLGRLADGSHMDSLVRLVAEAKDETDRAQARDALAAVCRRLEHLGVRVDPGPIVAGLRGGDPPTRAALLQAASTLIDDGLRVEWRRALSDPDKSLREAAGLALCETRDPGLLPDLLNLAKRSADPSQRLKAIRGYLVLATDTDNVPLKTSARLKALRQILPEVTRPDEKWLLLAGLAKMPDPETLELGLTFLDDIASRAEAVQAVIQIAASLAATHGELSRSALEKALAVASGPDQRQAAEEILKKIEATVRPPSAVTFVRRKLDAAFRSEGLAVADFDRDGRLDIATGNILYLGPDWKPQPMLAAPKEYKPEGYSDEFLCFAEDVDKDGWTDLIVVGFPGAKTRWLRNPGRLGGPWKEFPAVEKTGNESPDWIDADSDGRKELVFVSEDGMAFARPAADLNKPWTIRVIAGPKDPRPGHGLGVGDLNGDGRKDVVCPEGWWEAPADPAKVPWTFHRAKLGYEAPAQMLVLDVDGDGDADVASSAAHRYGLWWYEQTPEGWTPHEIDHTISQLHALHLADLNRDGLPDLVTGKRFWAHREGDEGIDDPAVVCWFELRREGGKPSWIRHDVDDASGVGLHFQIADLDGDGLLDLATSNKKGVYIFVQEKS
jgi:HEAT repeat protein